MFRRALGPLVGLLALFAAWTGRVYSQTATPWSSAVAGDVIGVTLQELRPTQLCVGFDEVFYKLALYASEPLRQKSAICENDGQGVDCAEPIGTHREDMNTVVIGPDNRLYLTNGHHTFNVFWQMPDGGFRMTVHVVVEKDYRHLPSMDAFWAAMQSDKNVWLYDAKDRPIPPSRLPATLGLKNFQDDPYRSVMYFTNHVAWEKPVPSVPFVEFFWAREIRKTQALAHYDLNDVNSYLAALRAVSETLMGLESSNVGGSGKTADEMGQRKQPKPKRWERARDKWQRMLGLSLATKKKFSAPR